MKVGAIRNLFFTVTWVFFVFSMSQCGYVAESGTEMAAAVVSGSSNLDSTNTYYGENGATAPKNLFTFLEYFLKPIASTLAASACPTPQTPLSGCSVSSNTMSLTLSTCSFGSSGVWVGTLNLTSSSTPSCGTFPDTTTNATLTRTEGTATTRRGGSTTVQIDSSTSSGYTTPKYSGGVKITYGSTRSMDILGVELVTSSWDYTIFTSTALSISSAKVATGTLYIYNNRAQSTGTSTLNSVAMSTTCCFPTGGSMSTSYTGGTLAGKTETLTFSSTCGSATLVDTSGTSRNITLYHCL